MSAYIVQEDHLDALVKFARKPSECGTGIRFVHGEDYHIWPLSFQEECDRMGQVLMDENVRSVNHRYADHMKTTSYIYIPPHREYSPVEILLACAGLEYQSCETDDYQSSMAYAILEAIRYKAITSLPGYREADTWEIRDNANRRVKENAKLLDLEKVHPTQTKSATYRQVRKYLSSLRPEYYRAFWY